MSFLHLYLLGGLSLVALPVLVHLVTREKPKHLRFPAFRFLAQKYKTNRKKLRLHHLLLLLLRMLLILLLCLALARPRLHSERLTFLSSSQPVAAVLLFDTSSSMEFERGGLTRLEDARRRALELLDELPEGSKVAVLDSAERGGEFLEGAGVIRESIRKLEIRPANGPVTRLLDRAYAMLAELEKEGDGTTEPPPRYLYIFSDRTRACWDSSDVRNLKVPDGVSSVFVDVGVAEPEDLAIERLVVDPVAAPPGSEVNVVAYVRATGKRADRKLICQVGRHVQEQQAQVEAGTARDYTFKYRTAPMDSPAGGEALGTGSYQVVVRLEGTDRLPFNNTRFATFVVRPGRKVLVLADAPRADPASPDQFFNAVLLSLKYASTVRRVSDLRSIKLRDYDVVWLFQTDAIDDEGWKKLYSFVDGGGKLALVPAGLNKNWDSEEARRLLPARLLSTIETKSSLGVSWKFDSRNPSTFMASFIRMRNERENVDFIKSERQRSARRYWKVKPLKPEYVIARFDDTEGSPALLERDVGQGKVLLFTTKLGPEREKFPNSSPLPWMTYWDGSASFILAIVEKACRYLAGDTMTADWNYVCGESVSFPLPAKEDISSFALSGPGLPPQGVVLALAPPEGGKAIPERQLSISRAVLPGNYTVAAVRGGKQETFERFSLNVRPEEGLLTPQVPKEEIEAVLGRDSVLGVEHGLSLRDAIDRKPQPIDLLPWLMLALLVFLAVENLVANKRRELPPDEVARPGEAVPPALPASKVLAPLLLWTGLGAVAGALLGVLRGGESTGIAAGIIITVLLGASHGVLTIARFGPRDGGILGGLLGSIVGVLYGWLILAAGGLDGPFAVTVGLVLGAAVMALDGWFLGVRSRRAEPP
ncbi:MAG: BatA domain-containing protein [Planctomycetes bacterium]|nr:BatA domain-containing protein [Planctomycetota bacterium]